MRLTPAAELQDRIQRLQVEMLANQLDAILMVQNADLFYFTGSIQQGVLYVPATGEALYLVRKESWPGSHGVWSQAGGTVQEPQGPARNTCRAWSALAGAGRHGA